MNNFKYILNNSKKVLKKCKYYDWKLINNQIDKKKECNCKNECVYYLLDFYNYKLNNINFFK